MAGVLAIDTGRVTGFAYDSAVAYQPVLESVRLAGESDGNLYFSLADALRGYISIAEPDLIVFESPMPYGGKQHPGQPSKNSWPAVRKGAGYAAIVECVAAEHGIGCLEESVQRVRKHFVGHGRPENKKFAVVDRCQQLGWRPPDHNAADAAALWHFAKCLVDHDFGARITPLMARAVA